MNRRILFAVFFMLFAGLLVAQEKKSPVKLNIIPEPVEIKIEEGKFPLNRSTVIYAADDSSRKSAEYLAEYVNKHYGYPLAVIWKKCPDSNVIVLKNEKNDKTKGGYKLSSTPSRVEINGNDASGVFYGVQTFIQMLPTRAGVLPNVQCAVIDDYPRFGYRGMLLDVVRHFFPVEYVKRFIDYLAYHKLNYFHWHLTDDQGWRIEMKSHPLLTQVGAYRDGEILGLFPGKYTELPYGGYYTQDEIRDVIKYAAERHITVIPEIDIPGHCMAVLATYPQFSTTPEEEKHCARTWGIYNRQNNVLSPTPEVFAFLDDVFSELCDIFPSQYIHVGGDECAKKWWKESEVAQQFIKDNGLKDEEELQSYFIRHVQKTLVKKGKTLVGWNEILQGGLADDAVVMSWQGTRGGITAARQGHRVIMTPSSYSYFNNMQSRHQVEVAHKNYLPLDKVYNYEIIPEELTNEEAQMIMGAQGCMWTEYYPSVRKLENALFPRVSALAENTWTPREKKNWNRFLKALVYHHDRYDLWGIRPSSYFFHMYDVVREDH